MGYVLSQPRTKSGEKCWTCAPVGEGRALGMDTGCCGCWGYGMKVHKLRCLDIFWLPFIF